MSDAGWPDPFREPSNALRMTWGVEDLGNADGEHFDLEFEPGMTTADVSDWSQLFPSGAVKFERGGVGKGASGVGINVLIVLERILNDTASLAALGLLLRSAIKKVGKRRQNKRPAHMNDLALAAMAITANEEIKTLATGMVFSGGQSLFGPLLSGTDDRDVQLLIFSKENEGYLLVVFMAPSGLYLSHSVVPLATWYDGEEWHFHSE